MIDELKDVELYELLGVLQSSTVDEIKSAYRKKALKCHPDKNPDNPKAVELFHQLSKALEVLLDTSARAAYDKVITAKKAAKLRHQELDSRRKKFKEELEERERQADLASRLSSNLTASTKTAEEKLQTEIERLRKEGSRQLQEEIELVRQQVIEERKTLGNVSPTRKRLKIRWESAKDDEKNGGYNSENLNKIFSKYGDIEALIVSSKKKGSALVEFVTADSADKAQKYERGLPDNPVTVEWIEKPAVPTVSSHRTFGYNNIEPHQSIFPSSNTNTSSNRDNSPSYHSVFPTATSRTALNTDFESLVLRQMRQAEERKRLMEDIKKEDDAT